MADVSKLIAEPIIQPVATITPPSKHACPQAFPTQSVTGHTQATHTLAYAVRAPDEGQLGEAPSVAPRKGKDRTRDLEWQILGPVRYTERQPESETKL